MEKISNDSVQTVAEAPAATPATNGRAGFKQTKVGWIPEEWAVVRLDELIKDINAGYSANSEDRTIHNGERGVLKVSAVSYGTFQPSEHKVIRPEEEAKVKISPYVGDLILSRSNTEELVGISVYVEQDYPDLYLPDTLWQIRVVDYASARWLNYAFASERMRAGIRGAATGTSGSMKKLSMKRLRSLWIAFPPLPEQRHIAALLSTWDRALAQIDRLIAAKQRRKKALMQQLLTGRVRFPEFEGQSWRHIMLRNIASYYSGLSGKTSSDFGSGEPYIPYKNVFENFVIDLHFVGYVQVGPDENQNTVKYGDVLVTTSSEIPEEVGMTSVVLNRSHQLYLNSFCFGIRLNSFDDLVPEFAAYLFRSERVRRLIFPLAQGSTRFNLSRRKFMKLELNLPPIPEQKKIAAILSAFDDEINSLRRERTALECQKKGMMQKLLTGRVRVPVENEA